jgi:UMF1 family MFS transporter
VRTSIEHARAVPGLGRFLVGRFFYSDAVNTIIIVMSVVAVRVVGLTAQQYLMVTVLLTLVAITASFGWGRLVDRFGPKRTLPWVLASWAVGLLIGMVSLGLPGTPAGIGLFVIAGAIVGSGLGGVQVADRVFMLRLSPPARIGEFFGLYGLVGKGSQVVGQTLYGARGFDRGVGREFRTTNNAPAGRRGVMVSLCEAAPAGRRVRRCGGRRRRR